MLKLSSILLLAAGLASPRCAQVTINFSGGGGSPLTVAFPNDISFAMFDTVAKGDMQVTIDGLSTSVGTGLGTVPVSFSYEISGGSSAAINSFSSVSRDSSGYFRIIFADNLGVSSSDTWLS